MKLKKFERKDRYGNMISMEFDTEGLPVPMLQQIPMVYDHPGDPKGTDTVPAWLTPGEFVVNKEATDIYGPVIEKMNDHGREIQDAKMHEGGSVEGGKYHPVHRKEGGDIPMPTPRPAYLAASNIYDRLRDRGFSHNAAVGIVANFETESGFQPGAKQKNQKYANRYKSDGSKNPNFGMKAADSYFPGQGYGLAQWTSSRREDLKNFAAERDLPMADINTQLDFMMHEMSGEFKGVRDDLKNAQSPEAATMYFLKGYEKAGKPVSDRRTKYAREFSDFITSREGKESVPQVQLPPPVKGPNKEEDQQGWLDWIRGYFDEDKEDPTPTPEQSVAPAKVDIPPMRPEVSVTAPPQPSVPSIMPVTSSIADLLSAAQAQYKAPGGEIDDPVANSIRQLTELAQQATANNGMYIGDEVLEEGGTNYDAARHAADIQMMNQMQEEANQRAEANEFADLGTQQGAPVPTVPKVDTPPVSVMNDPDVERNVLRAESEVKKDTTDREDLGTEPTVMPVPKPVESVNPQEQVPPKTGFISAEVEELRRRAADGDETASDILAKNNIDPALSGEGRGADPRTMGDTPEDRMDWNTENSEAYKEYIRRSRVAGVRPMSPSEWREKNKTDDTGSSQAARDYLIPGSSESQIQAVEDNAAAADVLEQGGSAEDANTASNMTPKTEPESKDEKKDRTVADIIADGNKHTGPGSDQKGENSDATTVEETGKNQPPAKTNQAVGMFKSLFGDLFDSKELARMAVMYVGSRAMGYSHQGSLGFAAKNYITRVDTKVANRDKFVQDNASKFTAESLDLYRETGKLSDLVAVGKPIKRKGEYKTFYGEGGKKITGEKVESGDNVYYVDQNGKVINQFKYNEDPRNVPGTDEYESRVSTNSKDNVAIIKSMKTKIGEGKDGTAKYKTDINPEVEGRKVAEWAVANGVSMERVGGLLQLAMQDAINDERQDGSRAQSLIPYLNSLVIREQTQMPDMFMVGEGDDKQPVDAQKFMMLNEDAATVMRKIGGQGSDFVLANQYYTVALDEYMNNLTDEDRAQYERMAKDTGLSPFMVFVQKDLADYLQKTTQSQ